MQQQQEACRHPVLIAARAEAVYHFNLRFYLLLRTLQHATEAGAMVVTFMSRHGTGPEIMDGTSELLSLADVLRVGIDTAREIIKLRPHDAGAIEAVAQQMAGMAARLEAMTREENGSHPAGK